MAICPTKLSTVIVIKMLKLKHCSYNFQIYQIVVYWKINVSPNIGIFPKRQAIKYNTMIVSINLKFTLSSLKLILVCVVCLSSWILQCQVLPVVLVHECDSVALVFFEFLPKCSEHFNVRWSCSPNIDIFSFWKGKL